MFYQAVVASVLLYGSETWVVPPHDARALEGFNVECCRRITGMRPRKRGETWTYPASATALKAAGVRTVEHYIRQRHHTIHRTIIDRPILEECRGSERRHGSPPHLNWWKQDMELDLGEEEEEDDGDNGFGTDDMLEALPAAPEEGLNFNMAEMLEALPAASGVFNVEALAGALPTAVGVSIPPPPQRDPRERYMQRPDGR